MQSIEKWHWLEILAYYKAIFIKNAKYAFIFSEETLAKLKVKQETDTRELALFWKLLPKILENSPAASRLHDCALFEHTVRDVLYPGDWDSLENLVGTICFAAIEIGHEIQ